jgi:hypothetical protein
MSPAEEIAALRAELEALRTENKMIRLAGVLSGEPAKGRPTSSVPLRFY